MRLAIRLLGLDLLALEIGTDADCDCTGAASSDLGSDVVYSEPTGALGFTMPATDYGYDE